MYCKQKYCKSSLCLHVCLSRLCRGDPKETVQCIVWPTKDMCVVGDDADLCSELLQESLDALRALPAATLFDEGTVSSVWLEVVERATKFLRFVI